MQDHSPSTYAMALGVHHLSGLYGLAALQEGFWSWLSGVTDNSVYPVMFMSYLDNVVPHLDNGWRRYLILFVVSIALAYLNYR